MGLLSRRKEAWQDPDPEVRLKAVREIDSTEGGTLAGIVRDDQDQRVRQAALERIESLEVLAALAAGGLPDETSSALAARSDALRCRLLLEEQDPARQEELLAALFDPDCLVTLAGKAASVPLRLRVVEGLRDQELLCRVLEMECGRDAARAALARVEDPELLRRLAASGGSVRVRNQAAEKLAALITPAESEEARENPDDLLKNILANGVLLRESRDWELAANRYRELEEQWRGLDPECIHPLFIEFVTARDFFMARYGQEQEARRQAEKREALLHRCAGLCQQAEELTGLPPAAAEETFARLQAAWPAGNGEEAVEAGLARRFAAACDAYLGQRQQIAEEHEWLRDLLGNCQEAQTLCGQEPERAAALFGRLQRRFEGRQLRFADSRELGRRLAKLAEELKQALAAVQEEQQARQLTEAESLRAELAGCLESDDPLRRRRQVQRLERRWQELRDGLQGARAPELAAAIDLMVQEFHLKLREFYRQREWQYWANKNIKLELIASVEALDNSDDLPLVAEVIKEAQRRWKEVGPVPRRDSEPMWQRFRAVCDRNFKRCRSFFVEQDRQRQENEKAKEALCLEAEAAAQSNDWQQGAAAVDELRDRWRAVGSAPRAREAALGKRFRKACNLFFERRRLHFAELDGERQDRLREKEALCQRAEELAAGARLEDSRRVRELQAEWKKIGSARREDEEAVWQRFRAACDGFYQQLDQQRRDNLEHKEDLCREVEELAAAGPKAIEAGQARLAELQERWQQIGPVPREEHGAVHERFRQAVESCRQVARKRAARVEQEHEQNLRAKQELLARAESLAVSGGDRERVGDEMRDLEKRWQQIGPGPGRQDNLLQRGFQDLFGAFFGERADYLEELPQLRQANLRRKEILCFRMEKLAALLGFEPPAEGEFRTLSLADEIKIAMESNFALAGKQQDRKRLADEARSLQDDWKGLGPACWDVEEEVSGRFRRALVFFESHLGGIPAEEEAFASTGRRHRNREEQGKRRGAERGAGK